MTGNDRVIAPMPGSGQSRTRRLRADARESRRHRGILHLTVQLNAPDTRSHPMSAQQQITARRKVQESTPDAILRPQGIRTAALIEL